MRRFHYELARVKPLAGLLDLALSEGAITFASRHGACCAPTPAATQQPLFPAPGRAARHTEGAVSMG